MKFHINYVDIIRPFAESVLQWQRSNEQWVRNIPIHSEAEAKLRHLLVDLGNADEILGIQNVGTHFERWNAGVLGPVTLNGLNEGRRHLTWKKWSYQVGLNGEALGLHSLTGSSTSEWSEGSVLLVTWYKTTFNAPVGNHPLALDMNTMSKGQVWITGQSIKQYWPTYKASGLKCHDYFCNDVLLFNVCCGILPSKAFSCSLCSLLGSCGNYCCFCRTTRGEKGNQYTWKGLYNHLYSCFYYLHKCHLIRRSWNSEHDWKDSEA
ncbi:hypothetical protein POM88_043515 [Heracleum sosnowskyi]|uniref:Beta-galactosidase galactose-binding domain-containing protein n=1 Tax=Heracleum sosnowskyi TaxID=360622 RepID=A0AAD8M368_9APIA|nr:hypothetical protein POM88_043515 [Heracleum sosnowskyi]